MQLGVVQGPSWYGVSSTTQVPSLQVGALPVCINPFLQPCRSLLFEEVVPGLLHSGPWNTHLEVSNTITANIETNDLVAPQ